MNGCDQIYECTQDGQVQSCVQFEAQKPNRAAAGVFKILVKAVCGATAADVYKITQ